FIPSHFLIDIGKRPDESLIQRRPHTSDNGSSRLRCPDTMADAVWAVIKLNGANGRDAAEFLVHAAYQRLDLLCSGSGPDDTPWLRFQEQTFLTEPALCRAKPCTAEPLPCPLC